MHVHHVSAGLSQSAIYLCVKSPPALADAMVAAGFGHFCSEVGRLARHPILAQPAGTLCCPQKHKSLTSPPRDQGTAGRLPAVMFWGDPPALLGLCDEWWLQRAGRVCSGGLAVVQSVSSTSRAAAWEVPLLYGQVQHRPWPCSGAGRGMPPPRTTKRRLCSRGCGP